MTEHSDLEDLAQRFLDLWQDQAQALASDPELYDIVSRLAAGGGSPAAGWAYWNMWPAMMAQVFATAPQKAGGRPESGATADGHGAAAGAGACGDREKRNEDHIAATGAAQGTATGAENAPGSTPAAASFGIGLRDLDQFARRLDALEKRLAALETGPAAARAPERRKKAGTVPKGGQ